MPKEESMRHKREIYIPHSLSKRAIYSFSLVVIVMFIGTVGMHLIEGYSYIDSFYFMSMLATAEGPTTTPATVLGKIFASLMAFLSVGTVIFAIGFILGPFFGRVLKVGEEKIKEEEKTLSKEIKRYEK
ncbi:MAG: hypothetical protein ACHQX1_01225 [Candidatus Micrarchaeales archaeon]